MSGLSESLYDLFNEIKGVHGRATMSFETLGSLVLIAMPAILTII
jgi:hypothetical protein